MSFHRLSLLAATAGITFFSVAGQVRGDVLFSDNFDNLTLGQNLNGRAPTVSLLNKNWAAIATNLLGNGSGGITGTQGSANNSATIDLGANFLSNNPGVYQLSLDITQATGVAADTAWIGFGFSQFGAATNNLVGNEGAPWMLFRLNGAVNVYGGPDTKNQAIGTTTSNTVGHTFKLTLDTTGAQWTLNAFIDSTQLDLNGAATGLTYTYAAGNNPTSSQFIGIATGMNAGSGNATIDNFSFTGPVPVPEPRLLAVVPAALAIFGGWRRWRRLS